MNWKTTETKPANNWPVLVAGVLEGERQPAVHLAVWDFKRDDRWLSIGFDDYMGYPLSIAVTHWMELPALPNA